MTSATSRAAFLSVVQRTSAFLRRRTRHAALFIKQLCVAVIRAAVTGFVFTTCVVITLYYLGVPVPGPAELIDKFESLGRLADILS